MSHSSQKKQREYSLPLEAQLAVDDFNRILKQIQKKALDKMEQLNKSQLADFIQDEKAFYRYKAIESEFDLLVQFIQVSELTIQCLCEHIIWFAPLQIKHYQRLWIATDALKRHNQSLDETNETLMEMLLTYYEQQQAVPF
ncbi:hypothetical protein QNI16_05645 [Cytophagaceae bacterium YF14B1]|uniref:Uncharacterized protein n=1 Tax=Xanthocytophaga flava TaxID=3048013 RepID=A0AAE3QJV5_9BACT|nr:hypothetical protein [Xanthocytophaga flavus]MDJ1479961.1 hypothetical protein [Xanthocytophaga flavus]